MILLFVQLAAFGAALCALPSRVVPLITRIAFVVVVGVLVLPSVDASNSLSEWTLVLVNQDTAWWKDAPISTARILAAAATGVLFAVLVSTSAYAVFCCAQWCSVFVFGKEWSDRDYTAEEHGESPDVLQTLFSLLFLSVLVLVVGIDQIVEFYGLGMLLFMRLPEFSAAAGDSIVVARAGLTLVIEAGRFALLSGMILGLPLFVTSLITDFIFLISNRYLPGMDWHIAVKLPLIVLVLLLILPQLSAQVVSVTRETTGKDAVRRLGKTVIQSQQKAQQPASAPDSSGKVNE